MSNDLAIKNIYPVDMSPIKQIELLASRIHGSISLAQGIPSFETPDVIKLEIIKAINEDKASKYSLNYGLTELRMLIQEDLKANNMYYNWQDEIIVTSGAAQAISATLLAILSTDKDEVILPCPSYASYSRMIATANGTVVYSKLKNKTWNLDLDDIESKITRKTAAILISNPNNPTGNIFKKEDLLNLADIAQRNGIYIITDEVYKDFIYNDDNFYSLAEEDKYKKNVIRVFSFSKAYAMTGWRVGYLHSEKKVINRIIGTHDSLITCAPVASQYGAIAAIKYGKKDLEKFNKILKLRREQTYKLLKNISLFEDVKLPEAGYFFFPLVKNIKNTDNFVMSLLKNKKVALVPGSAFGPNGEKRVRICFGQEQNQINDALSRLF